MVAGALFAAVLSLRLFSGTPVDAYSMLYALPVALVAATSGLRAGACADLVSGLIRRADMGSRAESLE